LVLDLNEYFKAVVGKLIQRLKEISYHLKIIKEATEDFRKKEAVG